MGAPARVVAGEAVQTPFGKRLVREVRNNGRLLVEMNGRALILKEDEIGAIRKTKV